eukprot:14275556-Alexandrium_andersonii.AAC.1
MPESVLPSARWLPEFCPTNAHCFRAAGGWAQMPPLSIAGSSRSRATCCRSLSQNGPASWAKHLGASVSLVAEVIARARMLTHGL